MADALNLNSLTIDKNGRVSFSGLGSGIDFQKAVDSIIAAKRVPIDRIESEIDTNTLMIAAYKDFRTQIKALQDALKDLRGAVSVGNAGNAFHSKAAFATTSRTDGATPTSALSLVGVAVSNAASVGSHTIEVLRVATAQKLSSDASTDKAVALGLTGSFEINGKSITVSATDTLQSIAERINNANTGTEASKVSASIVSPGSGEHYLVLTADDTGTPITFGDDDGVLQSLGVLDAGLAAKNELQAARTARLSADGLIDPDRFESGQIASKSATLSSAFSSATYPGSFQITGGAGSATINYTSTTSLNDLVNTINAETANTGIEASIHDDGNGYRLVLTETTGAAISVDDTNGLLAAIKLDNDLILERTSNTINDLFAGVTLNLFQAEEGTKIKFDVDRDLATVKNKLVAFVEAYNELRSFVNEQTQVDPLTGKPIHEDAVLHESRTIKDVRDRLGNIIGIGTAGVSGAYSVLAQIGITLVNNDTTSDRTLENTLTIDDTKLNEALLNNPEDVRRLFAFDFSTSDPRVTLISYNGRTSYDAAGYKLNLDFDTVTGQLVSANVGGDGSGADDGTATVNGNTITFTGQSGAEGLVLLYTGTEDLSDIQLDFTTGVASQMYFGLDSFMDPVGGAIENEIKALERSNTDKQQRVDRGEERLEYQREQMLSKFIAMEAALASMQNTLDTIKQMTDAMFQDK